jgi:methyl-accepting chemotaxis protein
MPLLQDQIKRIFERLKERKSHAGRSEDSVEDVAEALENVTEAVRHIEQRLQNLERAQGSLRSN